MFLCEWSIIPSPYIESMWVLMASARGCVGSASTLLYLRDGLEPLSAFLMIKVWSKQSCLKASSCTGV